jgi:hypothetical protein
MMNATNRAIMAARTPMAIVAVEERPEVVVLLLDPSDAADEVLPMFEVV